LYIDQEHYNIDFLVNEKNLFKKKPNQNLNKFSLNKSYLTTHFLKDVFGGSVDEDIIKRSINCSDNTRISFSLDELNIV